MMVVDRERPLRRLIEMMHNGRIKIITGIRRCGKSFLLSKLFREHLRQLGVRDDQIIEVALDRKQHEAMRNPNTLYQHVADKIQGQDKQFYLFIDEIQLSYKAYFDSPAKYYAEDIGLRNARLNFRQIEETHLMENILYNELTLRGFAVDVGSVRFAKTAGGQLVPERWHEIDFVVNSGSQKVYIQSAFSINDEDKHQQEILPLLKSGDSFRKLVVIAGNRKMHMDENGIAYVGIIPFLLEEIDHLI